MLSTFIEYANHNILYSAFKETNSLTLAQNSIILPERLTDGDFKNYSKVLVSNGECLSHREQEAVIPIEEILQRNKPSKE